MYAYWPHTDSLAIDELGATLISPLYASLADSPLFLAAPRELEPDQATRKALRKLEDGFVCPSGLPDRVEAFVRNEIISPRLYLRDHGSHSISARFDL